MHRPQLAFRAAWKHGTWHFAIKRGVEPHSRNIPLPLTIKGLSPLLMPCNPDLVRVCVAGVVDQEAT